MIYHSTVSLDYLEERLHKDQPAYIVTNGKPLSRREEAGVVAEWRMQGYAYAPPCDNVTSDGRCAGHEKEAVR